MTQNIKHTPEQIDAIRKAYDIPENFVPVASAGGAICWITKNAALQKAGA